MSFVIVFDIPVREKVEKVRINRELRRMGARRVQDSFWRHENLNQLVNLAIRIRSIGGKAEILEEKFLF